MYGTSLFFYPYVQMFDFFLNLQVKIIHDILYELSSSKRFTFNVTPYLALKLFF